MPYNERYRLRYRPPPRYALRISESAAQLGMRVRNSCGRETRYVRAPLSWNFEVHVYALLAQGNSCRNGGRLGGFRRERKVSPVPPVETQHELTRLRIVEETGPRMFGLEESDVMERRGYVNHVKQEIEVRSGRMFRPLQADNPP